MGDTARQIKWFEIAAAESRNIGLVADVTEVDASAGGSAQTVDCTLVPGGSILLLVMSFCHEAYDGDTTHTLEVGVSGNTDKYLDPVDVPDTAEGQACHIGGTNNDQTTPEILNEDTQLIATWNNTANATAGKHWVLVVYMPTDLI